MSLLLHIARRADWEMSVPAGLYEPASLASEGFIHCSTTGQAVETANQFYAGQRDLVLLCIDTNKLQSKVRYEAPACVGDQRVGSLFPHIYGPLNVSAVVRLVEFSPDADGKFGLPIELRKLAADLQ